MFGEQCLEPVRVARVSAGVVWEHDTRFRGFPTGFVRLNGTGFKMGVVHWPHSELPTPTQVGSTLTRCFGLLQGTRRVTRRLQTA